MLRQNTERYSEIQHKILGISKKMLAQTFTRLELDNIIKRIVYPVVLPQTEYNGTGNSQQGKDWGIRELGKDLLA